MEKLLAKALKLSAEYCDLRKEKTFTTRIEMKNGEAKKVIGGRELGVGIRVLSKGGFGFYSTNNLSHLEDAVERAVKLAKVSKPSEHIELADVKPVQDKVRLGVKKNPWEIDIEEKLELLTEVDKGAITVKGIKAASTQYLDCKKIMSFLSSENTEMHTEVTRTWLQTNLVAKRGTTLIGYRTRIGGTVGYEVFDTQDPVEKSKEGAVSATRMLTASPSPSGKLPVIVDPDLAGVFVHEALGHATEGDLVCSGESILEGKLGKKIASEAVTIYDDPTLVGGFGSYPYDDEGVKATRKQLIGKGVLQGYILDRESAKKLGLPPNGGARAESYASRPLVRMSNTMVKNGDYAFEELCEGIKRGVYVKGTRGGQVDPAKGTFQFSAQEAWLIEHGEITQPLRDVSLSGLTLETLKNIDAVGKDSRFGEPGFCGKGQLVPVGDGGPHIRIKKAIVGGG